MKTFFQLRNELAEGYESNKIKKSRMSSLTHGTGEKHNGHDGMASYHASMAGKYKGTEAGKHHQRASDHHTRAMNALRKGNVNGGLTHAKNALDAAKEAWYSHTGSPSRHSEVGKNDSMSLYHDHKSVANSVTQAKRRDDEYNKKGKPTRSDKPIQRAIGKTKSKIKKVLQMGEDVEQVDEISKKIAGPYVKKASDDMSKQADKMARAQRTDGKMDKAVNKFVNRRTGIDRAVNRLMKDKK